MKRPIALLFGSLLFGLASCEIAVPSTLSSVGCRDEGRFGPPVCPSSEICVASQCIACRSHEICGNGIDDDCNGVKDDGCGAAGASAAGASGAGGKTSAGGKGGAAGSTGGAGGIADAGAGGTDGTFGGGAGDGGASGDGGGTAHPEGGAAGDGGAAGTSGAAAGAGGSTGGTGATGGAGAAAGKGGAGGSAAGAAGKAGTGGGGTSGSGGSGGSGISGYNACIVFQSYNHTTATSCTDCQLNKCMVDAAASCFDSRQKTCEPMCTDVFGSVDIPCFCMCMVKTADCGVKIGNAYGCVVDMCSSQCM